MSLSYQHDTAINFKRIRYTVFVYANKIGPYDDDDVVDGKRIASVSAFVCLSIDTIAIKFNIIVNVI